MTAYGIRTHARKVFKYRFADPISSHFLTCPEADLVYDFVPLFH